MLLSIFALIAGNGLNRQRAENTENRSVCSQHKFLPYKLFQIQNFAVMQTSFVLADCC